MNKRVETIALETARVTVAGVSLAYGSTLAVSDVSLTVRQGEFLAIIGPSGCGKSTLLKMISGLLRPSRGEIAVDGARVDGIPKAIGFLFQSDALLAWQSAKVNVALGARLAGHSAESADAIARQLLGDLGLGAAMDKYPQQLSGGMRKRVALARTLAYEPSVFLLDEPFSALDAQTRIHVGNRFLRVLETLNKSVVIVTHDIDEAIAMADRVVVMTAAPGRIAGIFDIDLPRPRDYYASRLERRFREHQEQVWEVLRREMAGVLT